MKLNFHLDRKKGVLLLCFAALISIALLYLFVYIPANENSLNERRFRSMRRLENNIRNKAANTQTLIRQLTDAYFEPATEPDSITAYLKARFQSSGDLIRYVDAPVSKPLRRKESLNYEGIVSAYSETIQASTTIVRFSCQRITGTDTAKVVMESSTASFFQPLVPNGIFDQFIITRQNNIVYETFPSGLGSNHFDSLIAIDKNFVGSTTREMEIGGINYHLFVQPFSLDSAGGWIAAGLLTGDKYAAERNQLPTKNVLAIITIGLLIIVLLPWIKIFLMAPRDRLTFMDGALSFVVAMLLVSLAFFVLAKVGDQFQYKKEMASMDNLADTMSKAIVAYTKKMQEKLERIDAALCTDTSLQTDIRNFGKPTLDTGQKFSRFHSAAIPDTAFTKQLISLFDPSMYQVFLLDGSTGKELFNWNASNSNAPHSDYSKRQYFMRIAGQPPKSYYLDQVYSWTTGTFRSILSCVSNNKRANGENDVVCLSFNMRPADNPILPAGYSFAIVNSAGEVLYHSDTTHNLNENLLEELEDGYQLQGALQTQSQHSFNTSYYGRPVDALVKPIDSMPVPLSLVLLKDHSLGAMRDASVYSFTIVMLLVFFVLVSLQLFFVMMVSSRKSILKTIGFETDWIWPTVESHKVYLNASYFNIFTLAWLIVFYYFISFAELYYFLLIAVCGITLFINHLFACKYKIENRQQFYHYKLRNLVALYAFLFLYDFFMVGSFMGDDWPSILKIVLFQLVLLGSGIWKLRRFSNKLNADMQESNETNSTQSNTASHNNFVKSYSLMAITRLVVTSGLPVLFFYQHSFNYEQGAQARFQHTKYLSAISNTYFSDSTNRPYLFPDRYWVDTITLISNPDSIPADHLKVQRDFSKLLVPIRVHSDAYTATLDRLAQSNFRKPNVYFHPVIGQNMLHGQHTTYKLEPDSSAIRITSGRINYWYPVIWHFSGLQYWLVFSAMIVAIFLLIVKVIKKVFAMDIPGEMQMTTAARMVTEKMGKGGLLYLTGPPGSSKMQFIRDHAQLQTHLNIDLFHYDGFKEDWKFAPSFVINHFEYCITSDQLFKEAVSLLTTILTMPKKPPLIVVSSLHPHSLMLEFRKKSSSAKDSLIEQLLVMLGHFVVIILPVKPALAEQLDSLELANQATADHDLGGVRLNKLNHPIMQSISATDIDMYRFKITSHKKVRDLKWIDTFESWFDDRESITHDEYTWRVQLMASQFYTYLWHSLSAEEKYLVFDLAEDGLVNKSNSYHLSLLIQKGIVRRKQYGAQLQLMNASFRNYVITSVDRNELNQLQQALKGSGSWNEMRIPLLIMVVGILALLLASQQQAYSKIVGYLTAIAAIIPTLNTIMGIAKSNAPKQE